MKLTGDVVPIETRYKGYRFRSRLEARWACFFDALGIEWQYEPEGYEWGNGERYLPDFFLPAFHDARGIYAEVKPFASEANWEKAISFGKATQCCVLLLDGPPELRSNRMFDPKAGDGGRAVAVMFNGISRPDGTHDLRLFCLHDDKTQHFSPGCFYPPVIKAIYAARGARFDARFERESTAR